MHRLFKPLINTFGHKLWAPAEFKRIEPFINDGERVLDIGAGGGWTAQLVSEAKNSPVTLLDVKDFNHTDLPITIYDGKKMPFEDNSFDVALLLFVLHHCEDQQTVLREAMRVSKRVIVLEDTFHSWFGRLVVCTNDVVTNLPSFLVSDQGVDLPLSFKRASEWKGLFETLGLHLSFMEQTQRFAISPKKSLFVLDK